MTGSEERTSLRIYPPIDADLWPRVSYLSFKAGELSKALSTSVVLVSRGTGEIASRP